MTLLRIPEPQRPHEVVAAFELLGLPLDPVLRAMLDEERQHRSPRRGCGYTQAWRFLADIVNRPRGLEPDADLRLFAAPARRRLAGLIAGASRDRGRPPRGLAELRECLGPDHPEHEALRSLQALPESLERPESRLLAEVVLSILEPGRLADACPVAPHPEKIPIGTCPEAERFFLELAGEYLRRGGTMNVLVDDHDRPVMVEKVDIGDSHSCIALRPILVQGVRLPPGSLLGVRYDYDGLPGECPSCREISGSWIPVRKMEGVRFLRLTTLAIEPGDRPRAFTTHLERQLDGSGFFDPLRTELSELTEVAERQRPNESVARARSARPAVVRSPSPSRSRPIVGPEQPLTVAFAPRYVAPARVPSMRKLQWVADELATWDMVRLVEPEPVDRQRLEELHSLEYVEAFLEGHAPLARSQNLAWSEALRDAVLLSLGGQLEAADRALQQGVAANLAHGFHHARYARGAGYCTFNGLALVAQAHPNQRVAVLDCDEHPGDGTAEFTQRLPNLFNASIHGVSDAFECAPGERNLSLPIPATESPAEAYGEALESAFEFLRTIEPDLLVYQAGVDCHRDDPLHTLALTDEDLRRRDRAVFRWARDRSLPVLFVLSGGYLEREHLTRLHSETFRSCLDVYAADGAASPTFSPSL